MSRCQITFVFAVSSLVLLAGKALASESFRYPEAKHGRGELRYVHDIPVATLAGSPKEIGDQWGALVLKPATKLTESVDEFLDRYHWRGIYSVVLRTGNVFASHFPPGNLEEIDAAAKSSGWPREFLSFANTALDIRQIFHCSALIVEAPRSTMGAPMLGRNLDWPSVAKLEQYSVVVVYRPVGKRAFASVTWPGILGCTSGMNDAGLAVAMLDARMEKEGAANFNPLGTPTLLLIRRVLEECSSVEEAAQLIRTAERAAPLNLAVCDRKRGAVIEITPKTVAERKSVGGVAICTNHFRTADLWSSTECWRYELLEKSIHGGEKLSTADVAKRLDDVNQGEMTLQTMIFEPASLKLHLAFGDPPATQKAMSEVELSAFLQKQAR
jgi:hypothetical protein